MFGYTADSTRRTAGRSPDGRSPSRATPTHSPRNRADGGAADGTDPGVPRYILARGVRHILAGEFTALFDVLIRLLFTDLLQMHIGIEYRLLHAGAADQQYPEDSEQQTTLRQARTLTKVSIGHFDTPLAIAQESTPAVPNLRNRLRAL